MKIIPLIESIVIDEAYIDNIRNKYVGEGKPISEDLFQRISDVTFNKPAIISWMILRIVDGVIKSEDVYKYKEYLSIFNKHKSLFPITDINQIKTKEQLSEFLRKVIEIRELSVNKTDNVEEGKNLVSVNEIKKLESVGINYLGMSEGYQVFQVPPECANNEESFKVYKNVLGRCKGRSEGAGIDICTMANIEHFNDYLVSHPGSSYFVMYNLSDPQSPYQFHYESVQFMDKNDNQLI